MKHFTFEQFSHSDTAKRRGIDNSVPKELKPHAEELINKILDPLTDAWGSKLIMSSGFRGLALNNAVGGSKTSAHSYAYAADLVPANGKILDFKEFVMKWLLNNNINFDQFIDEYSGKSSWVHIGIRNGSGAQRKQYMKYVNGKYTSINPNIYKPGQGSIETPKPYVGNTGNNNGSGIDVSDIRTGGGTQSGSTEGLLKGKSVYLKDVDIEAIKSNDVFIKDENGQPMVDENGNLIVTDDYLFEANESVSDAVEDINDLDPEPFIFNMDSITTGDVEQVKGISFNADGSYAVSHSKSIQEIIALIQQWYQMVQTLKKIDFKHIDKSIKTVKEETNNEQLSVNAMVYMKAAFDMYGHAYREGMVCPICGKKARYLPPGGYCSIECLLKDVKDKSIAFLKSPNDKYAWLQEIIDQLCAVLDLVNLTINAIVLIPDIIRELAKLPEEWKQFVHNKIAEGFTELQELIQKAMVKKNELLEKMLKPINFGIIAKPIAMAMQAIDVVRSALDVAQEAFYLAYDVIKIILSKLSMPNMPPGLVLPAESFAWALTPRSFICPMYPTPANADCGKIFVNLPGGLGVPLQGMKPLLPSALQDIDFSSIDAMIQSIFPPLTPADYYLEPELFKVRYLFSDQSDLVSQIRQQLEDILRCGPDYIPKFENLLPVKVFTFNKGKPNEQKIHLPNLGYVWFLLGLMDSWAPHSKAMVGSILNPLV